ncbi:FAD-dependent monooxygenase [Nocardia sp. NPDC058058]|uniref:FAD-dependent monooxygenase n=1 Tax=Nocardia sp. NPDC058058 TaxID=3346317 RepID=UPI0036DA2030
MSDNEIYDVVQIGYGSVGQTMAALLGRTGHRVAVFERRCSHYLGRESCIDTALYGAVHDSASVPAYFGWEAAGIIRYHDHVEVRLRSARIDERGGVVRGEVARTVRTRYLIGADGAASLVRDHIGAGLLLIEFHDGAHTFECKLAERWRDGRIFLIGDAAHILPPAVERRTTQGVRDAQALAWRLDLALRGFGGSALLDSYESERVPHVRALIDRKANGMGYNSFDVDVIVIGTDPPGLTAAAEIASSGARVRILEQRPLDPASALPEWAGKHGVDIRFGREVVGVDDNGVRVTVTSKDPQGRSYLTTARRYVAQP